MGSLELLQLNLLSPVVLAFLLGVIATLLKSDLRIPDDIYKALSIYLLLAIGLKGGAALSETQLSVIWLPLLVTLLVGAVTPIWCFAILRKLGRFSIDDAAAISAHYGSTSAVTFIAALTFLKAAGSPAEPFLPTLLVILEIPGIVVALILARIASSSRTAIAGPPSSGTDALAPGVYAAPADPIRWRDALHEILSGRSILLLVGGLLIGLLAGRRGYDQVAPLFSAPFQGFLMLFLLEMGMLAAKRLKDLKHAGMFLGVFAIVMPIIHGLAGTLLGQISGLQLGGAVALGVLCASASYIAAPAAVRIALPKASPAYYLTSSLAITFPFNLTIGIPLYYAFGKWLYAA
jgi:hypothetical protein